MVTLLSMAVLVALAALGWNLYGRMGRSRIAALNDRRRTASRLVSTGTLVDGNRHLPVALALTQSTFFYENSDLEGSLDLEFVREVEYDTELATGLAIASGKVLRLRSDSQTFEFVLPADAVTLWQTMLPPRGSTDAQVDPGVTTVGLP
jgi:hypothetical protein